MFDNIVPRCADCEQSFSDSNFFTHYFLLLYVNSIHVLFGCEAKRDKGGQPRCVIRRNGKFLASLSPSYFLFALFSPELRTLLVRHRLLLQGKLVGAAWKELTDEGKVKWNVKAEKDKARYKNEMKDYTPPSDDDDSDDDSDAKGAKKPKAKRAKKDPNAPKRPMNAYMLYSNSIRAKIREDNPELTMGGIVSFLFLISTCTLLTPLMI